MTSPVAPTIDATGIHAPTYADILAYLTAQYQGIFGADAYLGNDSQDGQLLAVFAQALADACADAVAVYNSFSPLTAQGNGLSSVVKINGLRRLIASPSTVTLSIGGVAGTVITNGQAVDVNNVAWNLPTTVTIPNAGIIDVAATCNTAGAINAPTSTITGIKTPTFGWQTVTNANPAVPGAPVETDAQLRVRQGTSVALPSVTIFEGVVAGLEDLVGVTRVVGYENNTGSADANGIPAKSLAFVVENGTQADIKNVIAKKAPPGIPTYGTVSGVVVDAVGSSRTVWYSPPVEVTISVALTIKQLTGWSAAIETAIAANIANYLSGLRIGQNVSYTQLFLPAYAALSQYPGTYEIMSMTVTKGAGSPITSDITMAWNEAPVGSAGNVTFTLV
jgi:uncharacterized phage protein gp47/JayE